ncbi:MAG: S41 family peptidase [Pseudomonadota bacterium]
MFCRTPRRALTHLALVAFASGAWVCTIAEDTPRVDPIAVDTVRAVVSLARDNHYLGDRLDAAVVKEHLRRTREAFIRQLDARGDLLLEEDLALLDDQAVAEALASGDLHAVHALAARQRDRLVQRAAWVRELGKEGAARQEPKATAAEQAHQLWTARRAQELAWLLANGQSPGQADAVVVERYRRLAERAAARTPMEELELFLDAMLAALDPHSGYRSPPRRARGGRPAPRDLFGIGATLAFDGDYIQLQRLLGGGAAERSGLLNAGDRILSVTDSENPAATLDVVGWAIEEVANVIRGPRGSEVTLEVLPRGAEESSLPARVSLMRDRIVLDRSRVSAELVKVDGMPIGIIRVPAFYVDYAGLGRGETNYDSAASDVAKALVRLRRDAPSLGAILLDLRGNGGGALIEAVRMVGLFIDEGPVVRVRHANGGVEVFDDDQPGRAWKGPLAVLVDRYAASASEIVAAALQDYERATVIGELTYGKGSVQEPFDLRNADGFAQAVGRVSLTTAKFFRVNGESTQLNGVTPDIALPASLTNGRYGERFEYWPMSADRIAAAKYQAETLSAMALPTDELPLQSTGLWQTRPAYLRASQDAEPVVTIDSHAAARSQRKAFRGRLLERLGEDGLDMTAPLPILWSTLVRQDALTLLRRLVDEDNAEPVASHHSAAPSAVAPPQQQ